MSDEVAFKTTWTEPGGVAGEGEAGEVKLRGGWLLVTAPSSSGPALPGFAASPRDALRLAAALLQAVEVGGTLDEPPA